MSPEHYCYEYFSTYFIEFFLHRGAATSQLGQKAV